MAINDATGQITHNITSISELISQSNSTMNDIVGSTTYSDGPSFIQTMFNGDGEFAGMSTEGMDVFNQAIDKYINDIQTIISGFNEEANVEVALKGSVQDAVSGFLGAVKALLNKYVESVKIEKKEIKEANANWLHAARSIAGDISSDSESIRSAANGISVD